MLLFDFEMTMRFLVHDIVKWSKETSAWPDPELSNQQWAWSHRSARLTYIHNVLRFFIIYVITLLVGNIVHTYTHDIGTKDKGTKDKDWSPRRTPHTSFGLVDRERVAIWLSAKEHAFDAQQKTQHVVCDGWDLYVGTQTLEPLKSAEFCLRAALRCHTHLLCRKRATLLKAWSECNITLQEVGKCLGWGPGVKVWQSITNLRQATEIRLHLLLHWHLCLGRLHMIKCKQVVDDKSSQEHCHGLLCQELSTKWACGPALYSWSSDEWLWALYIQYD